MWGGALRTSEVAAAPAPHAMPARGAAPSKPVPAQCSACMQCSAGMWTAACPGHTDCRMASTLGEPASAIASTLAKFSAVKDVDSQHWGLLRVNPAARPPMLDDPPVCPPNIVASPTEPRVFLF